MRVKTIGDPYITAGVERHNLKGFEHFRNKFVRASIARLDSSNVLTLQILNLTK